MSEAGTHLGRTGSPRGWSNPSLKDETVWQDVGTWLGPPQPGTASFFKMNIHWFCFFIIFTKNRNMCSLQNIQKTEKSTDKGKKSNSLSAIFLCLETHIFILHLYSGGNQPEHAVCNQLLLFTIPMTEGGIHFYHLDDILACGYSTHFIYLVSTDGPLSGYQLFTIINDTMFAHF